MLRDICYAVPYVDSSEIKINENIPREVSTVDRDSDQQSVSKTVERPEIIWRIFLWAYAMQVYVSVYMRFA